MNRRAVSRPPVLHGFRSWLEASRKRRWAVSTLALAATAVGVMLFARAWMHPTPPDVHTADPGRIIAFLGSDDFGRLTSAERDRLLSDIGVRYFNASAADRRALEKQWSQSGIDSDIRRQIQAQLDLAMAFRMVDEYGKLSPEERGPFLDRMLLMVRAVGGGDELMAWLDSDPAHAILKDPATFSRDLNAFQRKLVTGTSAEQRGAMAQLGGDLMERAKRYRR